MHAAVSSYRGYSQVLFLGVLSRHVQLGTLQLQRGVGATLLDSVSGALRIKKRSLHRRTSDGKVNMLKIFPILIVCIRHYSEHWMAGFCLRNLSDKLKKILDYLSETVTQPPVVERHQISSSRPLRQPVDQWRVAWHTSCAEYPPPNLA